MSANQSSVHRRTLFRAGAVTAVGGDPACAVPAARPDIGVSAYPSTAV